MTETPTPVGPLDGLAAGEPARGLALAGWRAASLVQVGAFPGSESVVAALVETVAGIALPHDALRASGDEALRVLASGPARWILVARDDPNLEYALVQRIGAAQASIVDLTHGRAVLRLEGARARDLLAAGCALDLDPRSFPPGAFAQTRWGAFAVWLHALPDGSAHDLFVLRSLARALWDALAHAGAEYLGA